VRVDKAGHKHFMAKEIAEQPTVVWPARIGTTSPRPASAWSPEGEALDFARFDRVVMVACGTAFYACLTARYWFERVARLPVEVDIASEFRYREPPSRPEHAGDLRQPVGRDGRHARGAALLRAGP
jgi:glutamine---fructose-6-phosphate transaminase (isomerizing)